MNYDFKKHYALALAKKEESFELRVAALREINPALADETKEKLRQVNAEKLAKIRIDFLDGLSKVIVPLRIKNGRTLNSTERSILNLIETLRKSINEELNLDTEFSTFAKLLTKSFNESERDNHWKFGAELALSELGKLPEIFGREVAETRRVYPVISMFLKTETRYKQYYDHLFKILYIFSEKVINGML